MLKIIKIILESGILSKIGHVAMNYKSFGGTVITICTVVIAVVHEIWPGLIMPNFQTGADGYTNMIIGGVGILFGGIAHKIQKSINTQSEMLSTLKEVLRALSGEQIMATLSDATDNNQRIEDMIAAIKNKIDVIADEDLK